MLAPLSFWCTFIKCSNLVLLSTASKARRSYQFSGKITVKAKEKTYSKLEIPYQAEVLEGWVKLWIYGHREWAGTSFSVEEKYSRYCAALFPLLSATWALTTRLHCSTSGIVLLTLWTDPFSLLMPSAFPSGYMTCPCPKRPQPCLRSITAEEVIVKSDTRFEKTWRLLWFCFRCRTSAHPSSFPHTSLATSSLSSSAPSDPPFTLTATSCSSQMHQSFTSLSGHTRASWRYTLLTPLI